MQNFQNLGIVLKPQGLIVFFIITPASYLFRYEIPKAQLQALNSPSFSLIKSGAETITNYEIIKGSLKMTGR